MHVRIVKCIYVSATEHDNISHNNLNIHEHGSTAGNVSRSCRKQQKQYKNLRIIIVRLLMKKRQTDFIRTNGKSTLNQDQERKGLIVKIPFDDRSYVCQCNFLLLCDFVCVCVRVCVKI